MVITKRKNYILSALLFALFISLIPNSTKANFELSNSKKIGAVVVLGIIAYLVICSSNTKKGAGEGHPASCACCSKK